MIDNAARPDWSPRGDWIAFDRIGADGRYDVYARDVVSNGERCITCEMYALRKTNNFNATWHPSGDSLVIQVQSHPRALDIDPGTLVTPNRAVHSDLYLITFDRKNFWQLTQTSNNGSAVLDPHFSYDGDRLVWTQRLGTKQGRYGRWQLQTATLRLGRGVPRLAKPRGLEVGEQLGLRVAQEFTPDDRGVVVSGNLEAGQAETGADIYLVDLESGDVERLTRTAGQNDEFAHFTPRGDHILWTSNEDLFPRDPPRFLKPDLLRDLWIMQRDGSHKQRLTFFNSPGYRSTGPPKDGEVTVEDYSLGEAYVGDFSFSPQGNVLAVHVVAGVAGVPTETIYRIELPESFSRR